MSSQRGNVSRTRAQRHQNAQVFRNDKYDTSAQRKVRHVRGRVLVLRLDARRAVTGGSGEGSAMQCFSRSCPTIFYMSVLFSSLGLPRAEEDSRALEVLNREKRLLAGVAWSEAADNLLFYC